MGRIAALLAACLALAGCGRLVEVRTAAVDAVAVDVPTQSVVYAADGTRIATLRFANRVLVEHDELPGVLVAAVVAAEDRRFFRHNGVDARAIARAAVANQRAGHVVQGGSTITQQLVKNRYFPDAPDTFERKADEAVLALELERDHTKEEILRDYLNTIYFGAGAYGIQAAATTYFGVDVARLTLPRAALLAGLIRSPESASPYRHPERALAERARVLDAMVEAGAIDAGAADRARRAPLGVHPPPPPPPTRYPYFVELVKRALAAEPALGPDEATRMRRLFGGGLRIHTTIDPALQSVAQEAAAAFLPDPDDPEAAIAVIDHQTGDLVASVGGRDFAERQFDLATQGRRQPGSLLKPVAVAVALQQGWRLDHLVPTGPFVHQQSPDHDLWQVRSADFGEITLREALARSSNGAFARLALEIGPARIAQQAAALGVTAHLGTNPAMVLGGVVEGVSPLEMATAYGSIAASGVLHPTRVVSRITDADGRVLHEPAPSPRVAFDGATAWTTLDALRTVVEEGTGLGARIGERPAAGKTGTSQDHRDAWFVGSTPELTAAVWVGYPDNEQPMLGVGGVRRVEGGTVPAWIWRQFMVEALAGRPVRDFPYPAHLEVTVDVDEESGRLATDWCPLVVERTGLPTDLPVHYCPLHGPPAPPTPEPSPSATPEESASPEPTGHPTATPSPSPSPAPTPTPAPTAEPQPSEPAPTPDPTPTASAPASAPASEQPTTPP